MFAKDNGMYQHVIKYRKMFKLDRLRPEDLPDDLLSSVIPKKTRMLGMPKPKEKEDTNTMQCDYFT